MKNYEVQVWLIKPLELGCTANRITWLQLESDPPKDWCVKWKYSHIVRYWDDKEKTYYYEGR